MILKWLNLECAGLEMPSAQTREDWGAGATGSPQSPLLVTFGRLTQKKKTTCLKQPKLPQKKPKMSQTNPTVGQ